LSQAAGTSHAPCDGHATRLRRFGEPIDQKKKTFELTFLRPHPLRRQSCGAATTSA